MLSMLSFTFLMFKGFHVLREDEGDSALILTIPPITLSFCKKKKISLTGTNLCFKESSVHSSYNKEFSVKFGIHSYSYTAATCCQ